MPVPFKVLAAAALLALSGCATRIPWDDGSTRALQVGMTRGEVEAALGLPTHQFTDADGYRTWVYLRAGERDGAQSATELAVRFVEGRAFNFSHIASTTTTTTTP